MTRRNSRIWFLFALLGLLGVSTSASAEPNLLANPGFEDSGGSYDGWFTFGAGVQLSTPGDDNIIRTGAAASKIFGEFIGCPDSPQFDVGGFGQLFTPIPGMIYEASGYSFVSSGDPIPGTNSCDFNRLIAKIVFFDSASGGAELSSSEIVLGDGHSVLDEWVPFTVSAPAPSGALRVELLFLYLQPGCDTGAVYVDDTSFCEITPEIEDNLLVNSSFDAGLTGWSSFGNVFSENRNFLVRTPVGSAKMFGTFEVDAESGLFQAFSASEGSAWEFDIYSLTTCQEDPIYEDNQNYVVAKIVFRSSSNEELGSVETVIRDKDSPLGTWTKHSILANGAPEGTVIVEAFVLFFSPALEGGAMWIDDLALRELDPSSTPEQNANLGFELRQNTPNPFGASTRVDFVLEQAENVDVSVYDVSGRSMANLFRGPLGPGSHSLTWDGKTASGAKAPAGVYQYVLRTRSGQTSRTMMLTK